MADSGEDLDPAIARRILSERLRRLRAEARLSREEAGTQLEWSQSKLVRIEAGSQGVSASDLAAMVRVYGAERAPGTGELSDLARASRRPPWWTRHRENLSRQFGQLLSLEPLASSARVFHPLLVPGLLQTQDYARELLLLVGHGRETVSLIALRMERQQRFFERVPSPEKAFIFGEEALRHRVGSRETMRAQARHLLDVSGRGAAEVRIVPASAPAHPGLGGPFTLLGLQETSENLLFIESSAGDFAIKDPGAIDVFTGYFEHARTAALSPEETRGLLDRYLSGLEGEERIGSGDS